jgi:adenylosuccinate synthase
MKSDVLDTFPVIKACIAYKKNGETLDHMPYDVEGVEPVYTELKGWETDLTRLKSEEELPQAFKEYIAFLERELSVPVKYLSIGPDRDQTITRTI